MIDIFDASKNSTTDPANPAGSTGVNDPAMTGAADTSAADPNATNAAQLQEKIANAFAQIEPLAPSTNPLRAFAANPDNISFDFQLEQEEVLLLLRQHPVSQLKWLLIAILLILLPFLFAFVPLLDFLPNRFHVIALIGWYLLVLGFVLEAFLDWFYNVSIVTNERVIDVEFSSLLFKNISTARIERIEDVTVTTSGYLGAIFDYGNVLIQTAGATDEFNFENVPHPNSVSAFINTLLENPAAT